MGMGGQSGGGGSQGGYGSSGGQNFNFGGGQQSFMPRFTGNTYQPQPMGYRPGFQGQSGGGYQPRYPGGYSPMENNRGMWNGGGAQAGGPPQFSNMMDARPWNAGQSGSTGNAWTPPGLETGLGDFSGNQPSGIEMMPSYGKPQTGGGLLQPPQGTQPPAQQTDTNSDQAWNQWMQQNGSRFNGQSQVDLLSQGSFNPTTGAWSGPALPASSFSGSQGISGDGFTGIRDNVFFRNGQSLIGMLHGWNDPNSPGYGDAMKRLRSGGFMANMPGPASFGAPAAPAGPAATRPPPGPTPPTTPYPFNPNQPTNTRGGTGLPAYGRDSRLYPFQR